MSRTITSPFHLESVGQGTPPVVLIHGFGANGRFWRKWIPRLSSDHEVHTLDLMGFGRSATPPGGDYSPMAQARHLVEYLRRFGNHPPVVIGHSLGAGIAVAATLRLMDEGGAWTPGGLVLISGAIYPQKLPPFLGLAQLPLLGELFLLGRPPRFAFRWGLQTIVHDRASLDRDLVDTYRDPLRSLRRRRAILRAARQVSTREGAQLAHRLPEIRIPSLVIWGEEDRVIPPEVAHRLHGDLPESELVLLPKVGHLPPEEAAEASLAPVLEFLARRKGARRVAGGRGIGGDARQGASGPELPRPGTKPGSQGSDTRDLSGPEAPEGGPLPS